MVEPKRLHAVDNHVRRCAQPILNVKQRTHGGDKTDPGEWWAARYFNTIFEGLGRGPGLRCEFLVAGSNYEST
jgi:hypothetical protein